MTPVRSNSNKENCSPISSNCIIWQGPDLPCISLCKGDSISDVSYKIAVELCNLKDSFDFTSVDITNLLTVCSVTIEPQKTLNNILNLLTDKIVCVWSFVEGINTDPAAEPNINLPSCISPYYDASGTPYKILPQSQYSYYLGTKHCELASTVAAQAGTLMSYGDRITALEDAGTPTIPQVTPDCITAPGVIPGIPVDVDILLGALEADYCGLISALGDATAVTSAKASQNNSLPNLNTLPALVDNTQSMGSLYTGKGWKLTPANLSETLTNLWLTVTDLRGAVTFIQNTCCNVSCEDIKVDFDVAYAQSVDVATGFTTITLKLFFGVDTVSIPSTFYDCNQELGTKITISDQSGGSLYRYIKLRVPGTQDGILDNPTYLTEGYDITLTGTVLSTTDNLTLSGNVCLTDGTATCVKCVSRVATYEDPNTCPYCLITATGPVTIVYAFCPQPTTTTTTFL